MLTTNCAISTTLSTNPSHMPMTCTAKLALSPGWLNGGSGTR